MKRTSRPASRRGYLCLVATTIFGACGAPTEPSGMDEATAVAPTWDRSFDVVIVGAGTGGSAAAIQAARLGASVALLEETDWIGGQATAGAVPNMDGPHQDWTNSGFYSEFDQRIRARYGALGKSVGTCYFATDRTCFEPKVGKQVLTQMLNEAGVEVFLRTRVTSVETTGKTVIGVHLEDGRSFRSHVLVDATEYGDVIPLTPARFRIGNSLSTNPDPGACIQALTYVGVIGKKYDTVPNELQITEPPPGYDNALRSRFASYVAKNGHPFQGWGGPRPWNFPAHNGYRGMPDSSRPGSYDANQPHLITRTGINLANDYPGTTFQNRQNVGGPPIAYLQDRSVRKDIDCRMKLLTLQFLYYAQTELGESKWSIANDEGYDTAYNRQENRCDNLPQDLRPLEAHMPVMPYVRESRRIVAVDTLTAKEVLASRNVDLKFETSIAVGDYGTDLHGCQRNGDLEGYLNEVRSDKHGGGRSFQVPFETLIPEQVDGFLAAEKNIGVTRLAAGSTRLQPITMLTGQAVGVTAALATAANVQPRDLRPIDVQSVLLDEDSVLARYHFNDVPRTHVFWKGVQLSNLYGLMNGFNPTRFGVDDALTRAHAAVVLARLFELDLSDPPTTPSFTDVPKSHRFYAFIEAIKKAGITAGCGGTRFCPGDATTRAQLVTFLGRGLGWNKSEAPTQPIFQDVGSESPFFEYIQLAEQEGFTNGCRQTPPRQFCPDDVATRGQAAAIVGRVLLKIL